MKYIVTLNEKRYEVEVEQGRATAVYAGEVPQPACGQGAEASGQSFVSDQKQPPAAVEPTTAPKSISAGSRPLGSGESLTAPMPGTILEILCSSGQKVQAGQVLFILEAMKMENEISAPKAGTVTGVYVEKNDAVQTGAPLCTIE